MTNKFFSTSFGGGSSQWTTGSDKKNPNNHSNNKNNFNPNDFLPKEITPKSVGLLFLTLIFIWLATGFYRVNPGQEGVEIVFGKLNNVTGVGLQYNFPYPIGETITPDVQKVRRVDIGYRNKSSRWSGGDVDANNIVDVEEESLILTSDENIVDTDFTVFWRIKDTAQFLFNIRDPEQTIKIAAESAMREIVGQTTFDKAVTIGRQEIESRTRTLLQETLDRYSVGIEVEQVELQKSDPPTEVIDAFNDVQRARQDRDRLRNEAESYANSVVPQARGESARIVREAEGFKEKEIQESQGEATRFLKVYAQYRRNPRVVKKRIYMDTMADILGRVDKVIIDPKSSQILPYLKLPDAQKKGSK